MKLAPADFLNEKSVEPIAMLTAYTTPVAKCLEKAGIPIILVGDTVGMVEMGFNTTQSVTLEHIKYHIGAVRRGAPNTHVIGDLPYESYSEKDSALTNANKLIEAGADSVKLEGPKYDIIQHLVGNDIPVVGHTGLTPQTAKNFKQVGQSESEANRILDEANSIEKAGAFLIVLEHIPNKLGKLITNNLTIPTIGIGAGSKCDGQVLVINDVIGLGDAWPPFSKQYAYVSKAILNAAKEYKSEVENGTFEV